MIKKLLLIIVAIVAIIMITFIFQTFRQAPNTSPIDFFQGDFFSGISKQLTRGLTTNTSAPAQVNLEELGELSPVAGMVEITKVKDGVVSDENDVEYIEIRAKNTNAQPINISNWSLQSMISDVWIGIPQGTSISVTCAVNELEDIYLAPGEKAVIATAESPVGVSFRVNRCSGFLSNTQVFTPSLHTSCIAPQDVVPPTIENLKKYGDACVAFVEQFDSCTYVTPAAEGVSTLSTECLEYIQPRLTYNYCTGAHSQDANFNSEQEWRIYLNQDAILWREKYEIIRLLDEHNRTVDVFNY